MSQSLCICDHIPKLDLKTRVTLVIHRRELTKSTNTGRLAIAALKNSAMRVRGKLGEVQDLSDLLSADYRTVLFYPSKDAVVLNSSFIEESSLPIHLIVPDGSWRQAGKVNLRHQELKSIPRVMIDVPNQEEVVMRAKKWQHGMATLHAVASAMEILEGVTVKEKLMDLYRLKVERTMMSRGHLGQRE